MLIKLHQHHSTVAGAPRIAKLFGSEELSLCRAPFFGTGAPSQTTLPAGNGKYNALNNGYIVSVNIANGGAGYAVNDQLVAALIPIVVDDVDSAGAILNCHVTQASLINPFPAGPIAAQTITGNGAGAQFNLIQPAPDRYFDITTLGSPIEYVCTTSGDNGSSVWAKISGGGGGPTPFIITGRSGSGGGTPNADSLLCAPVNGWTLEGSTGFWIPTGFGAPTLVAKALNMRKSQPGWFIQNATYTFGQVSSGADADNTRTSIDSNNNPQAGFALPPYVTATEAQANVFKTRTTQNLPQGAQCYIYAEQPVGGSGATGTGNTNIPWQEMTPARGWVTNGQAT